MRVLAAIVLATVVATPALAIDIVSGSGNVIKNGAGLNVVNGEPCAGRMQAACLDRDEDRNRDVSAPVVQASEPVEPEIPDDMNDYDQCTECE